MTKRDGDPVDKMTKMDRTENSERKSLSGAENGHDYADLSDVIHSPGKSTGTRQSSSGSFSEFSAISFRDSPRSAPSSLPGSRCGSTPGSRLASRSNSQESIIDLFDSMTLQFGQTLSEGNGQGIQLFSPKPRPLRHPKWSWQERVRVNHAIWRSWHMQYVKGKKPVICQFSAPTPDARQRLQADVIQGRPINKQWNPSQLGPAVRDYHKWRVFGRDLFMGDGPHSRTAEDSAINLDMPHPPLSPMSAQKLRNDDTLKDFTDTLFISTEKKIEKNFTVPAPKKITRHVYNSDIIQPGLMQLEPDFDQDFMETLDSLQDILAKTPTKQETDSMNYSLPPNFLVDSSLGSLSEAMDIADSTKSLMNAYPIAIMANTSSSSKPVVNQRSVTFAAAPPTIVSCQYDPMVSSVSIPDFSAAPLYHQTYSQAVSQGIPGQAPTCVTTGASRRNMQLPNLNQGHDAMQDVTSNVSNVNSRGQLSPQRSQPMVSTAYQSTMSSGHPTSSMASNQGYPSRRSKLGVQSPTPTSPPACMEGLPLTHDSSAATMGVINEAIDLLSSHITSSSSKMIPDWTTQFNSPVKNAIWAPSTSSTSDITGQLKTSLADATFLTYQQLQNELSCTMDPMTPMDQNTVLGQNQYAGNLSPGHQQYQVPSPGQHSVASPQQYSVASPQQHSVASPQQYSVASPQQHSVTSPPQHSVASPHQVASPEPQEELMDYEQYPGLSIPVGASGMTAFRQPKREVGYNSQSNSKSNSKTNSRANSRPSSRPSSRGNSRASSRANSPRASYAGLPGHFQDSLQAALQGKSDVKDLGLRSPSNDRDLTISVPSSCHASAASSAASSPGSQIDYPDTPTSTRSEFEFHAPKPKRQKTPDSGSKEKEARRRIKHLHSEHKRRFNIQTGLDEIQGLIPGMSNSTNENNASKVSTATMLQKGYEYIIHLKEETNNLRKEVEKAKEEIEKINDEICECQDSLPDTGAPVNSQSERQLHQMCNEYINQQMKDNWKWWIFSMIARPLFTSYVAAVSSSPGANFDEEVIDWVEESCRLKPLRKLVYTIVRQVSTRTSVLKNPVQLPQEVREIIEKELEKPAAEHS